MTYFFGGGCGCESEHEVTEYTTIIDRTVWDRCVGVLGCTIEALNQQHLEIDQHVSNVFGCIYVSIK